MVEKIVKDYLISAIENIPTYTERPKTQPDKYYLVEKMGGNNDEEIAHSTVVVQSIGPTLYEAASMSEAMCTLMQYGLPLTENVARVSLNAEYNYTDTTMKQYRYQAVFDIVHY